MMQQTSAPATDAAGPSAGSEALAESAGRRLLGHGSIYTLGAALNLFASALAIPAATRLLGAGEFGTVTLAIACQTLLVPLANLALPFAILRTYFEREIDGAEQVAKGLTMSVPLVAFVLVGLVFISALAWGPALVPDDPVAILIGVGLALPGAVVTGALALLRAEERRFEYISVALVASGGGQALGICALLITPTPISYLTGFAIGVIAAGLAGLWLATALRTPPAAPEAVRRALRYSLPIVPSTLSLLVLAMGDRIIIQLIDGSSVVGKYQIGYALGSIGMILITALQSAWLPITFGAGEHSRWGSLAETAATVVRLAALTAGFLALVATTALRVLVPSSYDPVLLGEVAGIVALATLPVASYAAQSQVLLWTKHTRPLAVITPVAAAVNLILVAALLPPFGLKGAAAATGIAVLLQALMTAAAARRVEMRVPWRWRRNLDSYVIGAAAVAVALLVPDGVFGSVVQLAGAALCAVAFAWTVAREWRPRREGEQPA